MKFGVYSLLRDPETVRHRRIEHLLLFISTSLPNKLRDIFKLKGNNFNSGCLRMSLHFNSSTIYNKWNTV